VAVTIDYERFRDLAHDVDLDQTPSGAILVRSIKEAAVDANPPFFEKASSRRSIDRRDQIGEPRAERTHEPR
jgi:hypothetical protein